jgi:hypothetical protein
MPGASVGTRKWLNFSPVRTSRIANPASAPLISHILLPLMIHDSPSRTAIVRMLCRSDPAPGSVSPRQSSIFPCAIGMSQRCFCSSEPKRVSGPHASPRCAATISPVEPHPLPISASISTTLR